MVSVNKFLVILTVPFPVKVTDDTEGTLSISNNKTDINLLLLWRCEFYALSRFCQRALPTKDGYLRSKHVIRREWDKCNRFSPSFKSKPTRPYLLANDNKLSILTSFC